MEAGATPSDELAGGPPYFVALILFPVLFAMAGFVVAWDRIFYPLYPIAPFASAVATYAIAERRSMSKRQAAVWGIATLTLTVVLLMLEATLGVKTYDQTK